MFIKSINALKKITGLRRYLSGQSAYCACLKIWVSSPKHTWIMDRSGGTAFDSSTGVAETGTKPGLLTPILAFLVISMPVRNSVYKINKK